MMDELHRKGLVYNRLISYFYAYKSRHIMALVKESKDVERCVQRLEE